MDEQTAIIPAETPKPPAFIVGEVVEYEPGKWGKTARNGAIIDLDTHRIAKPPHPSKLIASPDQARSLAHTRWHGKRQDAILAAVQRATGDVTGLYQTYDDADGYLTGEIVEKIILDDSGHTRGSDRVKAWEAVLAQSGTDGRAPKATQAQPTDGGTLHLDRETLVQMAAALRHGLPDVDG